MEEKLGFVWLDEAGDVTPEMMDAVLEYMRRSAALSDLIAGDADMIAPNTSGDSQ